MFLVLKPYQQWMVDLMRDSPIEEYNILANSTISVDDDPDYTKTYDLIENLVFRDRTHAYVYDNNLLNEDFSLNLEEKYDSRWFRGTDTVLSENPYNNWVSIKKWPLNEELNLHMLRFQQVTLQYIYSCSQYNQYNS